MLQKISNFITDIFRNIYKDIYRYRFYHRLKKINNFEKNIPGNILVETIWEAGVHYLRTHLVLKGIYKTYGSSFFSIKKSKRGFLTDLILSTFKFKGSIILDENKKNSYLKISNKILKNVNNNKDLFKVKLRYNFPIFLFYDSHLKRQKIPTVNYKNKEKLIKDLSLQLYLLDQFSIHLKKNKFNALVTGHHHGLYYSTITWLCLKNKIKVFRYNQRNKNLTISILNNLSDHTKMLSDWITAKDVAKIPKKRKHSIS